MLRGQSHPGWPGPVRIEDLMVEQLLPFRHKVERDYVEVMRSSFVVGSPDWEAAAVESEVVDYQF